MTRINLTDISPDGLRVVVDWEQFTPGMSFFLPCVNYKKALDHIVEASKIPRAELEYRVLIEDGKYGLRVWRNK
jgi:hypothetical protein